MQRNRQIIISDRSRRHVAACVTPLNDIPADCPPPRCLSPACVVVIEKDEEKACQMEILVDAEGR